MTKEKIYSLYDNYPRRYGRSKKILYSKQDFLKLINRDNGFEDVFISIYAYESFKEVNGITKIDSESAIVNKIFMDMDFKDWETEEELYEKIMELEIEHLRKLNLLRVWVYSGGGFHLYIYIKNKPINKKVFCRNACNYISKLVCNEEEIYIDDKERERTRKLWDPHCPIKLSQMARVIGTYNPKRHLFCISLSEEDLDKGLHHIKEKARKQSGKVNYLGKIRMELEESLDSSDVLESCNILIDSGIVKYSDDLVELLDSLGIPFDEIPLCMKYFLKENQKLDYTERYLIVTFLYRCGLTEKEIKEVLKIILTSDRLYHCCGLIKDKYVPSVRQKFRVETQITNIIECDYYISCSQVRNHGFCNKLCDLGDILYYFS